MRIRGTDFGQDSKIEGRIETVDSRAHSQSVQLSQLAL